MAKVDGSLQSLLQGVSQQKPRDRLPGQCTKQENLFSDPVDGLTRRAPTDMVGAFSDSSDVRGWYNFETRDGGKFTIMVRDGTMEIRDYNAVEQPLTIESAAAPYLAHTGELTFGVLENEVVVSNTTIAPAMLADLREFCNVGSTKYPMAIVEVRGGQYGRTFKIYVDGVEKASFKCPDGSTSAHTSQVATSYIAEQLFDDLVVSYPTGWSFFRVDDVILMRKNTAGGAAFEVTVSDDYGNVNIKGMSLTVDKTADLPKYAPHGYLARVATEVDPEEDLFLEFVVNGWEPGDPTKIGTGYGSKGYWQETVSSTTKVKYNLATMPHVLEYDPDTEEFTFRQGSWRDRKVGTDVSNPEPSFIGRPIRDIVTFQSRLLFLAGRYACMSRTNKYEDFWMGSASQLVETDPVDISSTSLAASDLRAAVPNNRDLVVFSSKGQFLITGRTAITPSNAALMLTCTFECNLDARPASVGKVVFFGVDYGRFTNVREFFADGTTEINDAQMITSHVKKYLVGSAKQLVASSNYDLLLARTSNDSNEVYVYQYLWKDNTKVQSAWHKWIFHRDVEYIFFDEEKIYLVMSKGSEHILYRMSLDVHALDGVAYPIHLDSRFDVHDLYTAFVLPYNSMHDEDLIVIQGADCPNPGMRARVQGITYDAVNDWYVVTLKDNMYGGSVVCGVRTIPRYMPTLPAIKDSNGVVIGTGKLRAKKFIVTVSETGHMYGTVTSRYADPVQVEFQGRFTGAPENIIGYPALSDEQFDIPFRDLVDRAELEIWTDRWLPMTVMDIEWVGQWSKSGRRISDQRRE